MKKKPHPCPVDARVFHRLVNMAPREIASWAKDPRARCASFEQTRRRLPQLAKLKGKRIDSWAAADCQYAKRVNSFNTRHLGQMKQFGCTLRQTVALMNWGHKPKCPMPKAGCSTRPPPGKAPKKGPGDR